MTLRLLAPWLFTLLLGSALPVQGTTHISGSIGGKTLKAEDGPFIVEADITVPKGQKTTIQAGSSILFKPFTGLIVAGHLEVLGTVEKRVFFSSINDEIFLQIGEQPAAPFDWNGISIESTCERAAFRNVNVSFSVFGIKSRIKSVVVDNGIFSQNGQYHFTINDQVITVHDNIPVYHYVKEEEEARRQEKRRQEEEKRRQEEEKREASRQQRLQAAKNVGLGTLFAAGLVSGVGGGLTAIEIGRIDQRIAANNADPGYSFQLADTLNDLRKQEVLQAAVFFGGSGVAITTSTVLFLIQQKKKAAAVPKVSLGFAPSQRRYRVELSWAL